MGSWEWGLTEKEETRAGSLHHIGYGKKADSCKPDNEPASTLVLGFQYLNCEK